MEDQAFTEKAFSKFEHPFITADGQTRASVALSNPQTLWFNTGTLCNITCENCYIESSPTNDRLVYITDAEVREFLHQIRQRNWPIREIGFTGGEPFMNPEMTQLTESSLAAGFDVLILTNAMQPMMRPRVQADLQRLNRAYPGKLTLRISLDHWSQENHDKERGAGTFAKSIKGMKWLRDSSIRMAVAARTMWGEAENDTRQKFAQLFKAHSFDIDADDPAVTVLFPEMDATADVPEITDACWGILNKDPGDVMCASSRMVVKRKGAERPVVTACTLLAYEPEFELGETLEMAEGSVQLNHRHCAKFCVLGGASCSAS